MYVYISVFLYVYGAICTCVDMYIYVSVKEYMVVYIDICI